MHIPNLKTRWKWNPKSLLMEVHSFSILSNNPIPNIADNGNMEFLV